VKTVAELRAMYWDPALRALVIPVGRHRFAFGRKLLSETTDTTAVQIQSHFRYTTTDGPPRVCSCGKLSFRHAVAYHDTAAR
jgi:hypothetical protein